MALSAEALHPDAIIIEGSSNDYGQPADALAAAAAKTLALLLAEFPDARINGHSAVWTDTLSDDQVPAINAQMRSADAAVDGT